MISFNTDTGQENLAHESEDYSGPELVSHSSSPEEVPDSSEVCDSDVDLCLSAATQAMCEAQSLSEPSTTSIHVSSFEAATTHHQQDPVLAGIGQSGDQLTDFATEEVPDSSVVCNSDVTSFNAVICHSGNPKMPVPETEAENASACSASKKAFFGLII